MEVIHKAGISEQRFNWWRAKYVGLEVDQVRQLSYSSIKILLEGRLAPHVLDVSWMDSGKCQTSAASPLDKCQSFDRR